MKNLKNPPSKMTEMFEPLMLTTAGLTFEGALREYLESFRLPGESQKIYRILESWSRQFYRQCPGFFKSADAVLILSFSLVLLNTDKHNRTVSIWSAQLCVSAQMCSYN